MVEKKKATKKSKVVAEEKENLGMFKRLWRWYKNNEVQVWFGSSATAFLSILLATFIIEFEALKDISFLELIPIRSDSSNILSLGFNFSTIVKLVSWVSITFLSGILMAYLGLFLFEVISPYERIKQDISYQFNMKYKKILDQIAKEKDTKKKKELERQAFALRQEYESRISENLQKNDGTFSTDWREALLVTRKRLIYEEERLLARNIANLRIGIVMASVGIIIPVYYILSGRAVDASENVGTFVASYWPFFTIVIIIEIVAIFFLRLYSLNESRIEKNKNEMTNIELRLTAGLMLSEKTNKDKFAELADTLSKEERNFILGKNESSAVLDTDKLLELLSKIPKIGS